MSKIHTLNDFQTELDDEFAWRLKEIADLKISVRTSQNVAKKTLIRAGLPLLYAHWEGFVKRGSETYLDFISGQRRTFGELQYCFVARGAKRILNGLVSSDKSNLHISAVDFILSSQKERANFGSNATVGTRSNLNSEVFEDIALSIGLDPKPYESKYNLIDESLLRRRNGIAHGEYLDLGPEEYRTLADEVLELMRMFKTDVENAAALGQFVRQQSGSDPISIRSPN